MEKIKKVFGLKIIALILSIVFLSIKPIYPSQNLRLQVGAEDTYRRIKIIENHISGVAPKSDYFSFSYSPLGYEEKRLIEVALPAISKKKLITIKSFGVGGNGQELYETAKIIVDYLLAHNIQDVKIQLIAYDKIESKLMSVKLNIDKNLPQWNNIECRYVLVDLNDKEKYEVLVREKADILFCRHTWLTYHNNWDFNRGQEFSKLLADNVNEGGVVYIVGLGLNFFNAITEIKKMRIGL